MRTIIVIIVIIVILYFGYRGGKKIIDNFDFGSPKFIGADLANVFSGNFATVDLGTTITNKNNFSVPVSGLYFEVYYQGQLLGKSTMRHDNFTIPANGSIEIMENVTLALGDVVQIAGKLLAKQPIEFTYMVRAFLWNVIPITVRNKFMYP